jgi:5-oxoprolinase (ATP-hydrolysing)
MTGQWQFWVDRGGTFTDVVARTPEGRLITHKLLTHDTATPPRYRDAAVAGIRDLLGVASGEPIPAERIAAVRMGTTVATNALLERTGDRTALVITRGFGDALAIAYQNRPRIFDRHIVLPEPLHERVIEVDERVTASGDVVRPPDLDALRRDLRQAFGDGIRSVAVVCLHSHAFPEHERLIGELAAEIGFDQVSLSSEVSPLMKLVPRGDTAVVDAYLSPILARYVDQVAAELTVDDPTIPPTSAYPTIPPNSAYPTIPPNPAYPTIPPNSVDPTDPPKSVRLMFMQSNGGLTEARHFRGKDAILSGPAGGIVGMVRMSALAGEGKVIGFDMGGTSTDVSHYAGEYERVFHTEVAGVRLRAPMLDIHTVAAGGGSILHFDGSRYRVGPDSAGADPGPACYRNGGPLTVTDANVMLGRIQPAHFPSVFGPDGDLPLDPDVVRKEFGGLADRIGAATGDDRTPEQVAEGYLAIAVANMANAVKKISVQKGHDITEYALTTFGGAGGQHACAVADALAIRTVLVPPMAGVLSALGIGLADTTAMREQSIETELPASAMDRLELVAADLEAATRAELHEQDVPPDRVSVVRRAHLRYADTDTAIPVKLTDPDTMRANFHSAYRRTYSFLMDRPLIVEALSVEATGTSTEVDLGGGVVGSASGVLLGGRSGGAPPLRPDSAVATARLYSQGKWREVPLCRREELAPGAVVAGPAIVAESNATTVVDDGWEAAVTEHGHLRITRVRARADVQSVSTATDPVLLEIFNNLFMSIAEQMGARLEATAQSVNIKERLDFSCALFDPDGNLIANAPHMPVHLGSMGSSVQEVIRRRGTAMKPGDVYAVNDPYHGGTHLPDVTVVTPVYAANPAVDHGRNLVNHARIPGFSRDQHGGGGTPLFFVAARGHHAEIGGITPGSMPAFSRDIHEEGVLFDNWLLVENGRFREAETLDLLTTAPYPSRNPATNLADLRAQIAANEKGVAEVHRMIDHFGLDVVQAYMQHVQDNAEEAVRRVIDALHDGAYSYEMDSGALIKVEITVDRAGRSATVDFTGTSPQLDSNFNAPRSVATAATLYVFRTLVADDIPLNDGCLRPLRIIVPDGSLLAPAYPAPVVAGNVETSQAVTGALYAALGAQAEGSGTMNNVTFGNDRHQYYETVGSGAGAGEGFDGASVVQTHMTNSRLTDPEVLESRFPVFVDSFAIRHGSGGAGRWRGGEGAVRRLRFTEAMTVSTLSGHRRVPPYGMAGGEPGTLGRNRVERSSGEPVSMAGSDSVDVGPGDVLVIETPGGGGYGTGPWSQPSAVVVANARTPTAPCCPPAI